MVIAASPPIQKYFDNLNDHIAICYSLAEKARKKGLDLEEEVPILLAKNMAERVVGLISVVAPQIMNTSIPSRIIELEKEFGLLDWRVGFKIAEEVAKEIFCKFNSKQEAIETGIRIGFAYLTLGIVSAPLEGFIGIKIKKRKDGKEYIALQYAGPIRAAGGTASSTSVILSDYVRVKLGYSPYDPDEMEINRYVIEISDYHERVTNLQYRPSDDEIRFMVSHLPVEVDGDPTEDIEVSNYKDLPRIETNMIRGGVSLVVAEGLTQKAPKLWKRLSKWGKSFDLEWEWLGDFIKLKEKIHSAHADPTKKDEAKDGKKTVQPNNTFIMDLVAGRPILTHPLAVGGFRLRYGRGRTSGFSALALHPATLIVLDKYIAIGTQLKVERPGKAGTVTLCDTIEGPIVRLKNGSVLQLKTEDEAKKYNSEVEEIIFLGDILFNYGDFSENGQLLVPAGYCPEWWALELEKSLQEKYPQETIAAASQELSFEQEFLKNLIFQPLFFPPTFEQAVFLSKELSIPLHPNYIFYWKLISLEDLLNFSLWLKEGKIKYEQAELTKIILPYYHQNTFHIKAKKVLDYLGLPHQIINKDNLVISKIEAQIITYTLNFQTQLEMESLHQKISELISSLNSSSTTESSLVLINKLCPAQINDKAGTFIGARMGRPEKAKMREMTGSPQVMFPVGEEGDRLRSFQSALQAHKINSHFPLFYCESCKKNMIYHRCEECNSPCLQKYYCRFCGDLDKDQCRHGPASPYKIMDIDINYYFTKAKERLKQKTHPDLIKGIRGTSNKNHLVEHLAKGILRAKHNIYVNKDGTTRYDCTELPLTHFKPKEIKTSILKLKELGFSHDIYGQELTHEDQILEMKSQDIILPGFDSLDESAPKVLSRVANFIDDLLVNFYGLKKFYKIEKEEDLVGHLVIGLAPHISAGTVGRIIGFSDTQGLITHPLYHAGMRRDCLTYDTFIPIFNGKNWEIIKIGDFVESLNPNQKLDNFGTVGKKLHNYSTFSYNKKNNKIDITTISEATKHQPSSTIIITTENGRKIEVTENHIFYTFTNGLIYEKKASELNQEDFLIVPHNFQIVSSKKMDSIHLPSFYSKPDLMIHGIKNSISTKINSKRIAFCQKNNLKITDLKNYLQRDSWPYSFIYNIIPAYSKNKFISIKRDTVKIPSTIKLTKEVLWLIGLYIAEGCSRKKIDKKGFYQVSFAATEKYILEKIKKTCKKSFNLTPSCETPAAIIYSSKLFYIFFTEILNCGSNAHEKTIPSLLLNLDLDKLKYLLQGYFDGDGSTDKCELRVTCDTVSEKLIHQLSFVLGRYGIYFKTYTSTRQPGKIVQEFYLRKHRDIPLFTCTKITIPSNYCPLFAKKIGFSLPRKQTVLLKNIATKNPKGTKIKHDSQYAYLKITSLQKSENKKVTYCLNVDKNHNFVANNFLVHNCDGDEACVMLLMDALLNFSRKYLPEKRGAKTMDAPLVLTSILNPAEVDDQVHGLDIVWRYPLELYEAALEMKAPWEVRYGPEKKKIEQINDRLGTPLQYEQFGFTHHVDNFNKGVRCSAYKTQPSMEEKLLGQMEIARKVRAVDMDDVAKLVIQKHFLKDIKGNLRKFSMQQFRCVKCNTKYRRPPLIGKCSQCGGKLLFTITEGSVIKYLGPSLLLAEKYDFSPYLKQTLNLLKTNVDYFFGKEKEKQVGLGSFIPATIDSSSLEESPESLASEDISPESEELE